MAEEDGDAEESLRLARRALANAWALDEHRKLTALSLHSAACALIAGGEFGRGASLLAAAENALQRVGMLNANREPIQRDEVHQLACRLLAAQLTPSELDQLTARGRSLTLDDAVAAALG